MVRTTATLVASRGTSYFQDVYGRLRTFWIRSTTRSKTIALDSTKNLIADSLSREYEDCPQSFFFDISSASVRKTYLKIDRACAIFYFFSYVLHLYRHLESRKKYFYAIFLYNPIHNYILKSIIRIDFTLGFRNQIVAYRFRI